jgi:hypothetical protein
MSMLPESDDFTKSCFSYCGDDICDCGLAPVADHQPPSEAEVEWDFAHIEGLWCVGMKGNLDTIYDATLRITGGWLNNETAREVAQQIVEQHNSRLDQAALTTDPIEAAQEIGRLSQRMLDLAPTAGLYIGIKINPAPEAKNG